jgi:twitching motility protein PilT
VAQLDPLLKALVERNARELVLAEGECAAFRIDGELRPVSQKPLSRSQIAALLAELSGHVEASQLTSGHPVRFTYRPLEGGSFLVQTGGAGALRARLAPEGAAPPANRPDPPSGPAPAPAPATAGPEVRAEIERYLVRMVELRASDLHLSSGEAPMYRTDGDIGRMTGGRLLAQDDVLGLLEPILPERNRREFQETHDTDFAHEVPGVARFRVNVFRDRQGVGAVFRIIPSEILTAEKLGLSAAVLELCRLSKGLILVTGPTGSGKSTTLAAMLDHVNRTRSDHIITIEDPIEFVHRSQRCLVNQREVITHTGGFKRALRAALREDPDVVLVGEMRDLETVAIAIETAETGHLVFGTLHTTTACSTVDRIIDQFPADRQAQIRTMLAESLKGVVAQTLLKRVGGGRVAAMEILIVTPAIANLIREAKTFQIPSLMQTGKGQGMLLLNDALTELVRQRAVDPAEALTKAIDKLDLLARLKRAGVEARLDEAPAGSRSGPG